MLHVCQERLQIRRTEPLARLKKLRTWEYLLYAPGDMLRICSNLLQVLPDRLRIDEDLQQIVSGRCPFLTGMSRSLSGMTAVGTDLLQIR